MKIKEKLSKSIIWREKRGESGLEPPRARSARGPQGPPLSFAWSFYLFLAFLNRLFDFIDSSVDVHDLPNVLEARKIRKLVPKSVGDSRRPSGNVGKRRKNRIFAYFGSFWQVSKSKKPDFYVFQDIFEIEHFHTSGMIEVFFVCATFWVEKVTKILENLRTTK